MSAKTCPFCSVYDGHKPLCPRQSKIENDHLVSEQEQKKDSVVPRTGILESVEHVSHQSLNAYCVLCNSYDGHKDSCSTVKTITEKRFGGFGPPDKWEEDRHLLNEQNVSDDLAKKQVTYDIYAWSNMIKATIDEYVADMHDQEKLHGKKHPVENWMRSFMEYSKR